jgi:hypothetical protein
MCTIHKGTSAHAQATGATISWEVDLLAPMSGGLSLTKLSLRIRGEPEEEVLELQMGRQRPGQPTTL